MTLGHVRNSVAGQFEAEGVARARDMGLDGATILCSNTTRFKISVNDCQWVMVSKGGLDSCARKTAYNGVELMTIESIERPENINKLTQSTNWTNLGDAASISYKPFPRIDSDPALSAIWLGLASHCFLNARPHHGSLQPISYYALPLRGAEFWLNEGYEQKIDLEIFKLPPYLPKMLVFFDDGFFRLTPPVERDPPFNHGFTNTVFRVLAFTNLSGLEIPTRFTLCTYQPGTNARNSKDIAAMWQCDVFVTNLSSELSVSNFTPELRTDTRVEVSDMRLTKDGADSVGYTSDSGWLTPEQVKALPAFRDAKAVSAELRPALYAEAHPPSQRPVRIVLAALSVALGFLLYFVSKMSRGQTGEIAGTKRKAV
jgi:hypothetical protein